MRSQRRARAPGGLLPSSALRASVLALSTACGGSSPPHPALSLGGPPPGAVPPAASGAPAPPAGAPLGGPPPPAPGAAPSARPTVARAGDPTCPEVHVLGAASRDILREATSTCVGGRRFGAADTAALLAAIGEQQVEVVHPKCAAGYPTLHLVDARGDALRLVICANYGARDLFLGFGAVRARDPAAVDRWLRDRGFPVPERNYE